MALDRLTKVTGPGISSDHNWVGNNATFTGVTTTGSSFNVGISTFHSTLAEVHNIKSTGIITATGGSFQEMLPQLMELFQVMFQLQVH